MQQRASKSTIHEQRLQFDLGSVAERLKAPVLKTGDGATRS